MAATVSDAGRVPDAQRRAQTALVRLLLRDMRGLRRLLVASRLQASVPDWLAAVRSLVDQYGAAAASLAANAFEDQRDAAGIRRRAVVRTAGTPPEDKVEASLRWALKDIWDGGDLEAAHRKAEGVAQKLVLDQGRETLRQAVRQDREAVAYARAAALGACAFCKLMASRGAVYKNAGTAGRDADERFSGDASVVKFHDNCHCTIVPVFRGQQFRLSPHAAEWDRLYREYAQGHPGDQLRLFRRALAEHDSNPLPGSH
ncbi:MULTISPECIES: hypothetical protein [Streptomyces]|uniref:Uncharacterized protein n=2 Tax=Streptomyces TaxID=1883 RepID=A0A2U9NZV8_STRAS|nr:hypothetical protein [Streptomyces actuosus]AWT42561.1 hypothetical protein DMT42_09700 [Streptomyces actuosus]MBM4819767.1 hypothetical protein [Streptomyces actuosus]